MEPDAQGYATEGAPQPVETQQNGSEAGKTPDRSEAEGLKAEMLRERQARQTLEAQLSNPDFIFENAKRLGMTNEEAQAEAEAAPPTPKAETRVKPQELTMEVIEARLAQRLSLQKMADDDNAKQVKDNPQLSSDPVLSEMYQTLAKTMRYSDAATRVLELEAKRSSVLTPEQEAAEASKVKDSKAQATTGRTSTLTSSQATESEELKKTVQRNRGNVSVQRTAILEQLSKGLI